MKYIKTYEFFNGSSITNNLKRDIMKSLSGELADIIKYGTFNELKILIDKVFYH